MSTAVQCQVGDFNGGGIYLRCVIGNGVVRAFGKTHVLFVQPLLMLKGLLWWQWLLRWLLRVRQIGPPNP
jgi:hypothetical protein